MDSHLKAKKLDRLLGEVEVDEKVIDLNEVGVSF